VDRNVGEAIDASKAQDGQAVRVEQLLNRPPSGGEAARKGDEVHKKGFTVGENPDMHDLAQSKQP